MEIKEALLAGCEIAIISQKLTKISGKLAKILQDLDMFF